jgi:hypothetical protein
MPQSRDNQRANRRFSLARLLRHRGWFN